MNNISSLENLINVKQDELENNNEPWGLGRFQSSINFSIISIFENWGTSISLSFQNIFKNYTMILKTIDILSTNI